MSIGGLPPWGDMDEWRGFSVQPFRRVVGIKTNLPETVLGGFLLPRQPVFDCIPPSWTGIVTSMRTYVASTDPATVDITQFLVTQVDGAKLIGGNATPDGAAFAEHLVTSGPAASTVLGADITAAERNGQVIVTFKESKQLPLLGTFERGLWLMHRTEVTGDAQDQVYHRAVVEGFLYRTWEGSWEKKEPCGCQKGNPHGRTD